MTPSKVESKPEFCPLDRVSELFGISQSTAYRLERENEIRFVRIRKRGAVMNSRTLVDCDSMRAFFKRQMEENTTPGERPGRKQNKGSNL